MYKYMVNFSKRFIDGPFKGRLYHDYLRFVDWHSADKYKALCESGHVFAPCAGVSSYKVEDVTVTAID